MKLDILFNEEIFKESIEVVVWFFLIVKVKYKKKEMI